MRIKYYYTNKIVLFYFEDRDHYYYDLVNEIFDFLLNKRENERLDLFFCNLSNGHNNVDPNHFLHTTESFLFFNFRHNIFLFPIRYVLHL